MESKQRNRGFRLALLAGAALCILGVTFIVTTTPKPPIAFRHHRINHFPLSDGPPDLPVLQEISDEVNAKLDGFELIESSVVFDLSNWIPVQKQKQETTPLEPACYTRVLRLKRDQSSRKFNMVHFQLFTSGHDVWPVNIGEKDEVFRLKNPSDLKESGLNPIKESVIIGKDVSHLGLDGEEFTISYQGIFWNGFQDQTSGDEFDWAAFRLPKEAEIADISVIPPKRVTMNGVRFQMRMVEGPNFQAGIAAEGSRTSGSPLTWRIFSPEKDMIYTIRMNWTDERK